MNWHLLHPVIVHVAFGSTLLLILVEIMFQIKKSDYWETSVYYLWLVVFSAHILSVISGLIAKTFVEIPLTAIETMDHHQSFAFALSIFIFLGFYFTIISKNNGWFVSYKYLYLIALCLILIITAYWGGTLVYQHGVGVAR